MATSAQMYSRVREGKSKICLKKMSDKKINILLISSIYIIYIPQYSGYMWSRKVIKWALLNSGCFKSQYLLVINKCFLRANFWLFLILLNLKQPCVLYIIELQPGTTKEQNQTEVSFHVFWYRLIPGAKNTSSRLDCEGKKKKKEGNLWKLAIRIATNQNC